MKTEINTKIKVFPKLYVGLKRQFTYDQSSRVRDERVSLGFATPLEDNAAFRKRKETVDSWAQYGLHEWDPATRTQKKLEPLAPLTVDNVPVEGFRVTSDVRRIYWGGGNVVWRVEDPRGYELEISSENLMAILQTVGIQAGGVIPGKCVWARDGANNVLLHESTEEFKTAYKVGETQSPKGTKLGPEHIGCLVSMSGGYQGIYLGAGSCVKYDIYGSSGNFGGEWKYEAVAYHFFQDVVTDYDGKRAITLYKDPKPLLIGDKPAELSDEAALKLINNSKSRFKGASLSYGSKFSKVTRAKKPKSVKLKLEQVTVDYAMGRLEYDAEYGYPKLRSKELLLGQRNGQLFALVGQYTGTHYNSYAYGCSMQSAPRIPKLALQLPLVTVEEGSIKSATNQLGGYVGLVLENAPYTVKRGSKEEEEIDDKLGEALSGLDAIYRLVPEAAS